MKQSQQTQQTQQLQTFGIQQIKKTLINIKSKIYHNEQEHTVLILILLSKNDGKCCC
jgi:hypothetical protein